MNIAWVGGSVRARLMVSERRLGRAGAQGLAGSGSLAEALGELARGPYGRGIRAELGLEEAQRAIAETLLLNLRILAGWLPRDGLVPLRALAAWYELANVEDRLGYLLGGPLRQPFELGSLAVAWPVAGRAQTVEELRRILSSTRWGDPGGDTADDLRLGLRLAWGKRVLRDIPEARSWVAGALALLAARELFVSGRLLERFPDALSSALGNQWRRAGTFSTFRAALPAYAAWPLAGLESPDALWRGEVAWWGRIERDAPLLMRSATASRPVVVGAVGLLAADARRAAAALASVTRRDLAGTAEAFGAIA
jgi:hypothetical protein